MKTALIFAAIVASASAFGKLLSLIDNGKCPFLAERQDIQNAPPITRSTANAAQLDLRSSFALKNKRQRYYIAVFDWIRELTIFTHHFSRGQVSRLYHQQDPITIRRC
jgi:hypothetical protein